MDKVALRSHPFRIYYGPADDPLNNFYIPALSASRRYDRSAGFFSSSALAVAAAGLARLIQNDGRMRLLVGAALNEQDVEAIQKGCDLKSRVTERLLEHFPDPQDALLRQRLEALAWMTACGALEIKVALPRDERGLPIPAHQTQDYYHSKSGVFTDANGDRLAFIGSINESETAWKKNYENFSVYFSWDATGPYLAQVAANFDRLWQNQEPDWIALDIPAAVRARLLTFCPAHAPERDPLERAPAGEQIQEDERPYVIEPSQAERLLFQFIRDAPYLPGASGLGAATSAIVPWPHQARVAGAVVERFPQRAMLCDEVGLGKTIEAGLVIRQLLLCGRVQRCLILAPKSVLKQWQEELYEKFGLEIPRYEAGKFWGIGHDQPPLPAADGNPWDAFDVLLAGSQLVKRADRRAQMLAARGWDLLVVDEAHHARRKDFKERIYRPNRLLSLLNDLKEKDKFSGLLLMTATPMQVHPLEVWDLLSVSGLGGRWGADEDNFLGFFNEMRKPFDEADWELIFGLVGDELACGGQIAPAFRELVRAEVGPVKWALLEDMLRQTGQRQRLLKQLGEELHPHVQELARRHTPLSRFIFRNTRALLREYQQRGILTEKVASRRPCIERIEMRPEEKALYERIEDYISHFYQKYESERRGLGFVMTVYRRRLTSSLYAVRRSLERRLTFLKGIAAGQTPPDLGFFDGDDLEQDDWEQDDLDQDVTEEAWSTAEAQRFQTEQDYVEDFIQELRMLSVSDSKLQVLKDELNRVFKQRNKALVFTQYTDTLDYVRDHLVEVYGGEVACYSGRGGEVWNGIAWVQTTKEDVKQRFGQGDARILLCTESASEGLNLQTCGVLINYDMPWNPMRVEQRIGRIDRIGQEYDQVWISNYFYQDTIEDIIYQRLADRIDWFEVVVGDLQPILAEVGEVTRRLAMLPRQQRQAQLEKEIEELRQRLQNREVEALNLDQFLEAELDLPSQNSPVSLAELEALLTTSAATGHLFQPHPELPGAYRLTWQAATLPVTFSRACFDAHPDTVRFLSYGSPLFTELLASVPQPNGPAGSIGGLVRCRASGDLELRGWYVADAARPRAIQTLAELRAWLARPPALEEGRQVWKPALQAEAQAGPATAPDAGWAEAQAAFGEHVARLKHQQAQILKRRQHAYYLAERARAQRLLLKAAMVEIALGRQPDMFDSERYPSAFDEGALLGLQRHGFPWGALLKLAHEPGLLPNARDPYYLGMAGDKRESLKGRFNQLKDEAKKAVQALNAARAAAQEEHEEGVGDTKVQAF